MALQQFMHRLIQVLKKCSLNFFFLKLLIVRLLRTVNGISFQIIGACQVMAN